MRVSPVFGACSRAVLRNLDLPSDLGMHLLLSSYCLHAYGQSETGWEGIFSWLELLWDLPFFTLF